MVGPTNRDELVEALVEGGRQREGVAFAKLCKRLGINENEPELLKWVRIGMALVKEQKEFTGMPQARGRPKQQPLESIDVKRAREIELHQYYVKKIFGKRPSIELI